jgi:hypothetical protein
MGAGGALSFNGSSYVQVASNASLTLGNQVTFEAWVNPSVPACNTILSRGDGANNALTDYIFDVGYDGTTCGVMKVGFFGAGFWDASASIVPTNAWTHVAVTFDGTNKQFYINGVLDRVVARNGPLYHSGSPIYIGRQGTTCDCNFFHGTMDEVRVWNVVRTASQISQNFNQLLTGTEARLAAYYKFDYITGVTTRDSSTNGNTGTLVNRPVPVISGVPLALPPTLLGSNPFTNECHTPFIDPGSGALTAPPTLGADPDNFFVVKNNETVEVWGLNAFGETNIPPGLTNVIAIESGSCSVTLLALKADGTVVAWGDGSSGQANVPASATNVIAVAAGGGAYEPGTSYALKADGTVLAWGDNSYGQTNVPAVATNVVAISAGQFHAVALRADGTLVVWGRNDLGETNIPASATNVIAIAAGLTGDIALRGDGSLVAWGNHNYNQTNIPSGATNVVAIAAGFYSYLALKADGSLVNWGDPLSTNVPPGATNIVAIAESGYNAIALRADGALFSWGGNVMGPLSSVPTDIGVGSVFSTTSTYDVNTPGTYPLTYITTNFAVTYTNSRTLVVVDSTPPTITLLATNPMYLPVGTPFVDPGATATDSCAGDLTGSIQVSGTVNNAVLGGYTLTYSVTDPSGNSASSNRTVFVVSAPSLSGFAAPLVDTNPFTATVTAQLSATVNPNGLATTVYFQWGLKDYVVRFDPIALPPAYTSSNSTSLLSDISRSVVYHWQVVASNAMGVTYSPDQTVFTPGLYILAGDLNGDGIVSQSELNAVLSNYFGANALYMTNVGGLGHSNVTFQLTNSLAGGFSVQVSSNLINWQPINSAIPVFEFTDTNAPGSPTRYYRLSWP